MNIKASEGFAFDEDKTDFAALTEELKIRAREFDHTKDITTFLEHPAFPMDVRHNAKIFREKLAEWAKEKLA